MLQEYRVYCSPFWFEFRVKGCLSKQERNGLCQSRAMKRAEKNTATWLFYATDGEIMFLSPIIINIRGQIENRPLENTRFAGRKWLLAGR